MVFPIPSYRLRRARAKARKSCPKGTVLTTKRVHLGTGVAFFIQRDLEKKTRSGVDTTRPVFWDHRQDRWVG